MNRITLVNINAAKNHKKFWNVEVSGRTALCSWGRIGSWEQTKEFTFHSNQEAVEFAVDKAASKLDRGYIRVGGR